MTTKANQDYEQLQARIKELEAINLGLTKTLVEMEAENAELRKDAERYRDIRRNQAWHRYNDYSIVGAKFDYADDFQAAPILDFHIDRRLQQQADDGGGA